MEMIDWMNQHRACDNSKSWVMNKTPAQAWKECHRGDWMLWCLDRLCLDKKIAVRIGCDLALSVLHLTKNRKADRAITATLGWLDGKVTDKQLAVFDNAKNINFFLTQNSNFDAISGAVLLARVASAPYNYPLYTVGETVLRAAVSWPIADFFYVRLDVANLIRRHITPARFEKLVKFHYNLMIQ